VALDIIFFIVNFLLILLYFRLQSELPTNRQVLKIGEALRATKRQYVDNMLSAEIIIGAMYTLRL
jgi:hypothetical protein